MASQHQQLCTVVPRNGALYHPYVPPAMLLLFQLQEGYDGSLHLASCLYHQYVNIPLRGKSSFFHPSFRLQLTVIAKWVTVVDDVIETATMLIQIHSALELGIILVVRVELGYLHYAARCCTFSRPIYYRIRWPPERPPLIVGSYTELFTGPCWEFLHLLAIFNWPLSTRWRRFWLVISIYVSNAMCFGSAIPSVPLMLARDMQLKQLPPRLTE